MAAAIAALTLEANPNLGWRDMQHIIIQTSKKQHLMAKDWQTNGVGREFSHRYGYGLIDAGAMVDLAQKWTNVPKIQRIYSKVVVKPGTRKSRKSRLAKSAAEFEIKKQDCIGRVRMIYIRH